MKYDYLFEVWRPVVGYEGLYEVSNLGRVRGCIRYKKTKGGKTYLIGGNILDGCIVKGYIKVTLSKNKLKRLRFIHIIVAKAFPEICGEWFEGCQVHHNDFSQTNNEAKNLMVVSKEEHAKIHQESEVTCGKKSEGRKRKVFAVDPTTMKKTLFNSELEAVVQGVAKRESGISTACKTGGIHNGMLWEYA